MLNCAHESLFPRFAATSAVRHRFLFLAAYAPDFWLIEETFFKIKAFLQGVSARRRQALQESMAQALETVTCQHALGWFTHCGYFPSHERKFELIGSIFLYTTVGYIEMGTHQGNRI